MKRLTPDAFDQLVADTPNARIEADETFGLQFLMVGGKTVAVATMTDVEADA